MSTSGTPWYVEFFGDDYLRAYGHTFTEERAAREVAFVEGVLGLRPGDEVLDLCCGTGRHAVPLARRGLRVTGLDLSQAYLEETARRAREAGVAVETVHADMREVPFRGRFDAVINMFTAFGYLESEAEDMKVLEAVARALKPGGRLLLDMLNREWAVRNYVEREWREGPDGVLVLEHRELDLRTSRMRVRFTMLAPGGARHQSVGHDVRLYTLTETVGMLAAAGLRYREAYGGFGGEPYGMGTRRMIVVAERDRERRAGAPETREAAGA